MIGPGFVRGLYFLGFRQAVLLVLVVITYPFRVTAKAMKRWVLAVYYLPITAVDERVERINLMRSQNHAAVTESNLNVALMAEVMIARGESRHRDSGREMLDRVTKAVLPRPIEVPVRLDKPIPRKHDA